MKFRATLTERGCQSLHKAFLPTLEKFGKTCHILLGPDEVFFVQRPVDADGANVTVRFTVERMFSTESFRVASRHFNLVAFAVDVGLLLKVLKSAVTNAPDTLDVKLTQCVVAVPGCEEVENKPFLCFTARGDGVSLVQELPIGKPCGSSDIDSLVAAKDVASLCPWYLDLASGSGSAGLARVVDRMRALSSSMQVALCKTGDLHIQVAENSVMLGALFAGLTVYPQDAYSEPQPEEGRQLTAEEKLHEALQAGEAMTVHIQVKHLLKILSVSQLSQPSRILFGIAEGCGHVHVMFVYRDPNTEAAYDDSLTLGFKLPVRDED
ncbi:DNA damage checkpoint protein [Scenedesmus sp. NREL 46B-D3]|nr:DNA damage checkpoint protein [Scenedesmus sp. NREL 46B-D3]